MTSYPRTILNPEAFARDRPAAFDGVFDWTFLLGVFPRESITPSDTDASVEIENWFLRFETKAYGVPVSYGQMRKIRAETKLLHPRFRVPAARYILLWGKGGAAGEQPSREWNHCVNGATWPKKQPCSPEQIVRFARAWGFCADRNNFSLLRVAYSQLGLKEPEARRRQMRQTEILFALRGEQR